jgi:type I restriction enzyme, S subunit
VSLALSERLPLIAAAPEGIQKLRALILELAVRGKLLPQDPKDEPASELLKRIRQERSQLDGAKSRKKIEPPLHAKESPLFELPSSWTWVPFGEIALHNSGKTLDKGRNAGQARDYITTSNLYWGRFELSELKRMLISDDELERCTARKYDLLICEGGEAGRAAVWSFDREVCFQNHVHRARFMGNIDPYFGFRFFEWLNASGEIEHYRKGVGISNMTGKALASIPFTLPPLAEQHRIVAKADELMALCDRLESEQNDSSAAHTQLVETLLGTLTQSTDAADFEANWKRIAEHFDMLFTTEASINALQKTILQLAVMGRLIPQVQDDEPVTELLRRLSNISNGVGRNKSIPEVSDAEQPFAIPDSWHWCRVATLGTTQTGTTPSKTQPSLFGTDYPFIKPGDISVTGSINYGNEGLSDAGAAASGRIADPKSILMVCIGTIGKCGQTDRPCSFNQQINSVTPIEGTSDFALLVLQSPYFQNMAWERSSSTTLSILNKGKWESIPIPLPPLQEQKRIVSKIHELFQEIDQLRNLMTKQLAVTGSLSNQLISNCINHLNQHASQNG